MAVCRSNPHGGSIGGWAVPLTNRTGGAVVDGDLVEIDVANDQSFVTPTANQSADRCGVVIDGGANGAVIWVMVIGIHPAIRVNAITARGDYLYTTNASLLATPNAARVGGAVVARSLDTSAGAGTVIGLVCLE